MPLTSNMVVKLPELRSGRSKEFNLKLIKRAELLVYACNRVNDHVGIVSEPHQHRPIIG